MYFRDNDTHQHTRNIQDNIKVQSFSWVTFSCSAYASLLFNVCLIGMMCEYVKSISPQSSHSIYKLPKWLRRTTFNLVINTPDLNFRRRGSVKKILKETKVTPPRCNSQLWLEVLNSFFSMERGPRGISSTPWRKYLIGQSNTRCKYPNLIRPEVENTHWALSVGVCLLRCHHSITRVRSWPFILG